MFSKPKVQKGIPRLKRLVSTDAETQQQPIIRDTAEELRKKGEVRRVKRGKKGGEATQETERIQDSQPDGTLDNNKLLICPSVLFLDIFWSRYSLQHFVQIYCQCSML
jgi:hypothetical protein